MFGINGLLYIPNYLSPEQQETLLGEIDAQPWRLDLSRQTQQYGYLYQHKAKTADLSERLGDLPNWLMDLSEQLYRDCLVPIVPDQAIINEYEPGQGIGAHIDAVDLWGEAVVSLSLISAAQMDLTRGSDLVALRLEPFSLLVLRGESRYEWAHGMARRREDYFDGNVQPRDRRVSMTLRKARVER